MQAGIVVPDSVRAWRNCWQVMHTIRERLGRRKPESMFGQLVQVLSRIAVEKYICTKTAGLICQVALGEDVDHG